MSSLIPRTERISLTPASGRFRMRFGADRAAPVVLVVEDDRLQRENVVLGLLTRFTVCEASDGLDALQLLGHIAPPAAIVCDANMPRMDGMTFARAMRGNEKLRAIPIVMLTCRNKPLDVVAGINAGVRHYLPKPVKMFDLVETLRQDIEKIRASESRLRSNV